MLKTVIAYLPVYASAKFEAEIETDGKTKDEIRESFLESCEASGFICHQCANTLETDFQIDELVFKNDYDLEISEEE